MSGSTKSFLFPDVNVWLALSYERHIHHRLARDWFEDLDEERLCFCRFTQIGLLRLLTTNAVMGGDSVLNQKEAWAVYEKWLQDDRIAFIDEPPLLEALFKANSLQTRPVPKDWADSYLLAFASAANFALVTLDRALGAKSKTVLLLLR